MGKWVFSCEAVWSNSLVRLFSWLTSASQWPLLWGSSHAVNDCMTFWWATRDRNFEDNSSFARSEWILFTQTPMYFIRLMIRFMAGKTCWTPIDMTGSINVTCRTFKGADNFSTSLCSWDSGSPGSSPSSSGTLLGSLESSATISSPAIEGSYSSSSPSGTFFGSSHISSGSPWSTNSRFLRDPPPNWHQEFQQPLLGGSTSSPFLGSFGNSEDLEVSLSPKTGTSAVATKAYLTIFRVAKSRALRKGTRSTAIVRAELPRFSLRLCGFAPAILRTHVRQSLR